MIHLVEYRGILEPNFGFEARIGVLGVMLELAGDIIFWH